MTSGSAPTTADGVATDSASRAATPGGPPPSRGPGLLALLRDREYRALWVADTTSVLGDQVMRVSVSVLAYEQTHSAATTALVYALTFLPTLVGGAVLSGLADRLPRKTVMVTTDLARVALFAGAAVPDLPLALVATALVLGVLLGSAFRAAQTATLPDVLEGERYTAGLALRSISLQSAQLAGYAVGGAVVAAVGARWGLVFDAATFLVSAVLLALRVKRRPVPPRDRTHPHPVVDYGRGIGAGFSLIARSPRLRVVTGLAFMSAFYVVPEGLAAPYAATFGGAAVATGLLMAADPAGSALGAWLLVRFVPAEVQRRIMAVLATGPGLVLMLCWLRPGLIWSLLIWMAAGTLSMFQIPASVTFVRELPDAHRGQALGLVNSGMLTVQGLGVLLGGVVASATSADLAIGLAGAAGAVAALLLAWRWRAIWRSDVPAAAEAAAPRGGSRT